MAGGEVGLLLEARLEFVGLRMRPNPNADWLRRREAPRPTSRTATGRDLRLKARGADVPRGCRMRDGQRHGVASAPRRRFLDVGLRGDPLAFDGPVHGGATDTEELGDLESAVLATVHQ